MYTFQVDKEFLVRDDVEIKFYTFIDGSLMVNVYFNDITLTLDMDELLSINDDEVVTLHRDSENASLYL